MCAARSRPTRRPARAASDERGSAAAELALALPAVVLALLLGAGALGAGARHVALQDAAADAARLLGRGEDAGAAHAAVGRAVPGASMSSRADDGLVCVTARAEVALAVLRLPIEASSCALGDGR
ncbi:TadE family type IV pilus minor pilin [Microbacterium sp. NPDC089695]|uniref:TadE family type IV pilus minor pilin n=1 Tax=Microbacterium sp. NPDC089695 TaxID=3364198 RepID=UPI0037F66566